MLIEELKILEISELKECYVDWLNNQPLTNNTVNTFKTDAFYVLNHNPEFDFWGMLESEDFETLARAILKETLDRDSKGNVDVNIDGYLSNLRRFRRFVYSDTNIDINNNKIEDSKNNENKETKDLKNDGSLDIPKPTSEQVENYLSLWNNTEKYCLQEAALDKLFNQLTPKNTDLSDILLKTLTLNDFYSTNIFDIYTIAKHILSLDIDKRLEMGDVTLVDDIKRVNIGGKVINFYSFATKYCSHHKPLDYPIYDSYVDEVLRYFRDKDEFYSFKNNDLKEFSKFKEILINFRSYYNLEKYTLKELDQYIWQLGKIYCPKNYK